MEWAKVLVTNNPFKRFQHNYRLALLMSHWVHHCRYYIHLMKRLHRAAQLVTQNSIMYHESVSIRSACTLAFEVLVFQVIIQCTRHHWSLYKRGHHFSFQLELFFISHSEELCGAARKWLHCTAAQSAALWVPREKKWSILQCCFCMRSLSASMQDAAPLSFEITLKRMWKPLLQIHNPDTNCSCCTEWKWNSLVSCKLVYWQRWNLGCGEGTSKTDQNLDTEGAGKSY